MRVCILSPVSTDMLRPWLGEALRAEGEIPPGDGGFSVTAQLVARLLRGMPTDVIGLDSAATEDVKCWDGGLLRCWVVRRRPRHFLRDFYRQEVRLIRTAIERSDAEVIHAHWTYVYALAACRQKTRPWVLSVHDHAGRCLRHMDAWYGVHYLMTRYVYRKARHLTAVSPYVAEYAERCSGRPVTVIPNLLPEKIWNTNGEPVESATVIVSVISWGRLKNAQNALKAFRRVREKYPAAEYHLYGPGLGPAEDGEIWARAHGLHHGVSFRGHIPNAEIHQRIRRANLMLHPSWEESFGQSVAEALALGTPVVGTRQAKGVAWLLGQGAYGRLADAGRPESMADAILAALQNREETRRMAVDGQRSIRQLTDADTVINAYDKVFKEAMRR